MRKIELDEQFPISSSYRYQNSFEELADGSHYLTVEWSQAIAEYDISRAKLTQQKLDYVLEFFEDAAASPFLYFDRADNFCNDYRYEPAADIATWGELLLIDADANIYQLCKIYEAGFGKVARPITRPIVDENFRITSTTSYFADPDTGTVRFAEAPLELELFWQGYFCVLVRLIEQDLTYRVESNEPLYSLPEFRLTEVREFVVDFQLSDPIQSVSCELDLDLIVGSTTTYTKKISSAYAGNAWYKEALLWQKSRRTIATAEKTIATAEQVESAIALFRATYGGAASFGYLGQKYRIKDTPLTIITESECNFGIGSLNLIEAEAGSILDSLDGQTYIVPIIDSSGSMNSDIPNVESAIAQLRPLVQEKVYGNSQAVTDKYFKPIQYLGDEQWVDWLARDYRDDPSEPDKVIILAWINESSPVYHSTVADTAPTSQLSTDIDSFLVSRPRRDSFSAVVYAVEFASAAYTSFRNQLVALAEGDENFPTPLQDYGVKIRPDLAANTPASFYLEDLQGSSVQGKPVNYLARCWYLEQRRKDDNTIDLFSPGYQDQKIVPRKPKLTDDSFYAYAYGTAFRLVGSGQSAGQREYFYWRSKLPAKNRNPYKSREEEIDDPGPLQTKTVYYRMLLRNALGGGNSSLAEITEAQYDQRTEGDLSGYPDLYYGSNSNSGSSSRGPIGIEYEILDIIPTEPVPEYRKDAYFALGQCQDEAYRFVVSYGEGLESDATGHVIGAIDTIEVFFQRIDSKWVYALECFGTETKIVIPRTNGIAIGRDDYPLGIYNIRAVRVDGEVDDCGNKIESPAAIDPEIVLESKTIGFTNHNAAVSFEGIFFFPDYGGDAQAREHSEDLNSSNNSESTFIFASGFEESELLTGLWSGAKFTEYLVNWLDTDDRRRLGTGNVGRITTYRSHQGGLKFKLEMRSLLARLQQKNHSLITQHCTKTYGKQGDGLCNANLFGNIDTLTVTQVIDAISFRVSSTRTIDNFYGQITVVSGNRTGVEKLIDSYDGQNKEIKLRNSLIGLQVGDTLQALARCDKSLKACMDFDNAVNFGGFWHVPGVDEIRRSDR